MRKAKSGGVASSRRTPSQPIAIVSSDFHLWRALRTAQQQGYTQAIGVAAPTPRLTRFNGWLREYFAVASSWALGEW